LTSKTNIAREKCVVRKVDNYIEFQFQDNLVLERDIMKERARNTLCEAVVLNNLAIRLVATLYYKYNPTPFETKQFKSIEAAKTWIAQ
jgi:hypothetical protein